MDDASEERDLDVDRDRGAELDGLRIRQLAAMRRAAYRSRSYAIIAAAVAVVAAVQLVWMAVDHLQSIGWGFRPVAYGVLCIAVLFGAIFFIRKAIELHREARQSRLAEPTTPPDFSTLSDGSQQVRNLEDVR